MDTFQCSPALGDAEASESESEESEGGEASSKSAADPHCGVTQSGASRSVAPAMLRSATRFFDARNRGSLNWYLSMKSAEGRVRCV
jgi:hypothetical protein